MATGLSNAERASVREHLHAVCAILDQYPPLHWCEDPLLQVATAISITTDADTYAEFGLTRIAA